VLQDYAGALHAEGAFAGLSWAGAKNIAAAVSLEVTYRRDGAAFLRNRARNVLAGVGGMVGEPWGCGACAQHRRNGPRVVNCQLRTGSRATQIRSDLI
jgi:hypothetical protein